MNYVEGICNFCGTGCGHFLKTQDGTVAGISPSRSHPVSEGRLCIRGWSIHELLSNNDRIREPLVRKNGTLAPADANVSLAGAALESSNVNATDALVNMISLARQFDMQMKMLQSADNNANKAGSVLNVNG